MIKVPTDHHDLTRLVAFGNRQKIIVTDVACSPSNASDFIGSLTDNGNFFDLDFHPYSRIRLPLDDFNRSLLNVLPGKANLPDGKSEHWTGERQRYPRVTIDATIITAITEPFGYLITNGPNQLKLVTMEKLEIGKTYTLNGAVHLDASSMLHIDEWTQIADA